MKNEVNSPYFINSYIDIFFLCSISFFLIGILYLFFNSSINAQLSSTAYIISWVINWPHFSATLYRLYSDKTQTKLFPVTAYIFPWVIVILLVFGLLAPNGFGALIVRLFMIWSPFHFSGQSLGLILLYLQRAKILITAWERRLIGFTCFSSFIYSFVSSNSSNIEKYFWGITILSYSFPPWFAQYTLVWMVLCYIVFMFWFIQKKKKSQTILPLVIFIIPITQAVYFCTTTDVNFNIFVPGLHSLQYLFLAYVLQGVSFDFRIHGKWMIINIIGGIALFEGIPRLLGQGNIPQDISYALVLSLVQIHHFFVDGIIWKLPRQKPA